MVYLVYVDDSILIGRDRTKIDAMIENLAIDLELTREGDLAAFLGIQINKSTENGSLKLTQDEGLIKRVLQATGLEDCRASSTPANKETLGTDKDGLPTTEAWNYRSVVGMLIYLASSSRPEIAFAVHQCARFCIEPKLSHEQAVKRVARYLAGTSTTGIIYTPDATQSIHCFVDADFAGLWNVGDAQDPISVMSRTGFVICFAGCPLFWLSKLQSEVAISTTEAEYIALSQSLRDVILFLTFLSSFNVFFILLRAKPCCTVLYLRTMLVRLLLLLTTRFVLALNILV